MENILKSLLLAFVFIIACSITVSAQNAEDSSNLKKKDSREIKTLFGNKGSKGFMISLDLNIDLEPFEKQESIEIGGKMGGIVGHNFAMGTQALVLIGKQMNYTDPYNLGKTVIDLNGASVGMFMQPIILSKFPVHFSIPLFIGAGAALVTDDYGNSDFDGDIFLVLRPGFEIEFNVVKFMRLSVGVHYKYLYGMNSIKGLDNKSLNGLTGGVSLILGKF
ncbi:MAG: hypothetical protein IPO21_06915 [Bacteroidales bacterium]|nr:hypothetical protein [Bacteroidales bacterium]